MITRCALLPLFRMIFFNKIAIVSTQKKKNHIHFKQLHNDIHIKQITKDHIEIYIVVTLQEWYPTMQ